jgi:DNA-binding MarR family transcriptional regulator
MPRTLLGRDYATPAVSGDQYHAEMVRERSTSVGGLSAAEVRDEGADVTFLVWLTSRAATDLIDTALAPAGLDGDEFAIYSILTEAPLITPTELARWIAAPLTTVSSYVKRFEARGHVRREPNPADRRSYRIQLTPAGRRAYRSAAALFMPVRTRVAVALGEREDEVREALVTLRAVLDDARRTAAEQPK